MNLELLLPNLLTPMVLAFVLGILATRLGSDLKFPDAIYTLLTIYLLVAIGLKGGYKLSHTPFQSFILPILAAIALCILIPIWSYWILKRFGKFDNYNAAAIAAHYGSVSAVTFSAVVSYLDSMKSINPAASNYEGFMPGLLAIMEVPAIFIALFLARKYEIQSTASNDKATQVNMGAVIKELLAGKSSILLIGFLIIGFVIGDAGYNQVAPLFDAPFRGFLTLFLLEAGLMTGRRFEDLKKIGLFLVAFGICMPLIHAMLGIGLAKASGLGVGGATILGVLAASASYIAAPAACRIALPRSNPTFALTASLAITFPFNIIIGIPLYHNIAQYFYSL